MDKLKKWVKYIYEWIKSLFTTRYKVTVSFNNVYGDADDRSFIAKKIITQKEKHLKFVDEDNKVGGKKPDCLLTVGSG